MRLVTVGLDRTFRLETFLGGEAGRGEGEVERGVEGGKRQAKEAWRAERAVGHGQGDAGWGVSAGFGHREVVPGQWAWRQTGVG